jgi:uncharacterized protein YsxB (DUF464 family)
MEGLENIMSFFKHTQTAGYKLYDLFKMYCYSSYPKLTQEQFENVLVFLDKGVIRDLKKKSALYKYDNYVGFIKKEGLITRKLWNYLKGIKGNQKCLSKMTTIDRAIITEIESKVESLKTDPKNKPNITGGVQTSEYNESKQPTEPDYKSMLPVDWNSMAKGERVDFLQKVQDKRLYNYVLSIDESLKTFMNNIKKNKSSPINLYVNLFSFSSNTSEEAKTLIKSFIEALNMLGRARLQYVEVKDPPLIEIREVRK